MKFSGKELFELGVPQNKIKLFVGREFNSVEELQAELAPKEVIQKEKVFTWVDWILRTFPVNQLPCMLNGDTPMPMSRSELKRLFDSKSIEINGKFFTSTDECLDEEFPLVSWVWFPKGKRKNTFVGWHEDFKTHIEKKWGLGFQDFLWWCRELPSKFNLRQEEDEFNSRHKSV